MDGSTLTGRDAAEAIGLCMTLGASDARFDARRVADALRSQAGRVRLSRALSVAVRAARAALSSPRPHRRSARRSTALRAAAPLAVPARPGGTA